MPQFAIGSLDGPSEPVPKLVVVAQINQLDKTSVFSVVRRIEETLLPILRILAQSINHLKNSVVKRSTISSDRESGNEN